MRFLFNFLTAISLSACNNINSFIDTTIADYVPAWAGGLPKDAPRDPLTLAIGSLSTSSVRNWMRPNP